MVEAELGRFGDKRLAGVGNALLASMRSERTLCLPQLAKDRNQFVQFGRFVANPAVTTQEMLASTARLTDERAAGRHVLAIMDTTDLRFATHEASKRGFGRDANDTCPGLFLHPVLAVDAGHGGVIGLVDCVVLNRTEGPVSDHKTRAADKKELRRWLHGAEIAGDRLTAAAAITMVSDRESDIYDLFARRPAHVDLLCRSAHPRAMTTGGLLPAHCAGLPERGRATIEVPPKPGRTAREATVALRFDAIELRRPGARRQRAGQGGGARVVDVSEVDPPKGAEPVHWRLLTTHQVTTLVEAHQIVDLVSPALDHRAGVPFVEVDGDDHFVFEALAVEISTDGAERSGDGVDLVIRGHDQAKVRGGHGWTGWRRRQNGPAKAKGPL